MSRTREPEADRLRRCRLIFERATRDNVAMATAAWRIETEEYRARAEARRQRIAAIIGCGRVPVAREAEESDQAAPLPFWKQGQYA